MKYHTALIMPCLISGDISTDKSRNQYHKTWSSYNNEEVPLLVLMMNYKPEFDLFSNNGSIRVFRTDKKYPTQVARQILCLIAEQEGFEKVIQIDDDFIVKDYFSMELNKELNQLYDKYDVEHGWFNSDRRLFFTSHRKTPTILEYLHYLDDDTKIIHKGTKLWEFPGKDYGYSYNTKDGILSGVHDYLEAITCLRQMMNKDLYNFYLLQGEDVLLLTWLTFKYGILARRISKIYHKQYSANKHKINDSTYWQMDKPDLLPSVKVRLERNVPQLLEQIFNSVFELPFIKENHTIRTPIGLFS